MNTHLNSAEIVKPNFIILMTDQQRSLQHFPKEWVQQYLPNYQFFLDNGVVFKNNMCNTSPCGPSRASMFSGLYPAKTGFTTNQGNLEPENLNFAKLLNLAGYDIYYKGKLHMVDEFSAFSQNWAANPQSLQAAPTAAQKEDQKLQDDYMLKGWTSPDFGTALVEGNPTNAQLATLGGGSGYNDNRIVTGENMMYPEQESVLDFLKKVQDEKPSKPFCLVVSLLNPHDISLFPAGYQAAGYENAVFENYTGFPMPDSYFLDDLSGKPQAQKAYLTMSGGPLTGSDPLNYVKFYAYLHTLTDRLHKIVFNAIGPKLQENTIVIRMADHGEMGMAHGGLTEKDFNFYNETSNVPMIWYHPRWFKKGNRNQLISAIDLLPTLGTFAGIDLKKNFSTLQGYSYDKLLFDDNGDHADAILFNFNVMNITGPRPVNKPYFTNPLLINPAIPSPQNPTPEVPAPANIYGIRTKEDMKYAVYYSMVYSLTDDGQEDILIDWNTAQFELYDLKTDNNELINHLAPGVHPTDTGVKCWASLHAQLTALLKLNGIMPNGWEESIVPIF